VTPHSAGSSTPTFLGGFALVATLALVTLGTAARWARTYSVPFE
jgi:hypothetical protein